MNAEERELEQKETQRKLDESAARLRVLDARARKRNAEGAMAEVSGLQALNQRIRQQLDKWRDADEEVFEQLRDQVKRGNESLSRGTGAAADRLDRLNDATDRWLDAETEQVGAAFQIFSAWLGEEGIEDQKVAAQAREDLRAGWDDVRRKNDNLKTAAGDERDRARSELEDSLAHLKEKLRDLSVRTKQKIEGTEQRV
jgi:hypothetical protein